MNVAKRTYLESKLAPRMFEKAHMRRCKLHKCQGACCLYGAWVDQQKKAILLEHQEAIIPHLDPTNQDPLFWFDERTDLDPHTTTGHLTHTAVFPSSMHYGETVCVFYRTSDYKCGLQVASQALGKHPWALKPFYCILHPLDLDQEGRITVDDTKLLVQEKGSCLRPSEEPVDLLETFQEEIEYFLQVDLTDYLKKDGI